MSRRSGVSMLSRHTQSLPTHGHRTADRGASLMSLCSVEVAQWSSVAQCQWPAGNWWTQVVTSQVSGVRPRHLWLLCLCIFYVYILCLLWPSGDRVRPAAPQAVVWRGQAVAVSSGGLKASLLARSRHGCLHSPAARSQPGSTAERLADRSDIYMLVNAPSEAALYHSGSEQGQSRCRWVCSALIVIGISVGIDLRLQHMQN